MGGRGWRGGGLWEMVDDCVCDREYLTLLDTKSYDRTFEKYQIQQHRLEITPELSPSTSSS